MTEKEKMQQQLLYDANYDTGLIRERQVAKDLCFQFNQLRPSDEANPCPPVRPITEVDKHKSWDKPCL